MLNVDAAAIQLVPESVAREHCVLPVALANGKLKLVLPTTAERRTPGDTHLLFELLLLASIPIEFQDPTILCSATGYFLDL